MNIFFLCAKAFVRISIKAGMKFWEWYHVYECLAKGVVFTDVKTVRFYGHHLLLIKSDAKVSIGNYFISRSGNFSGIIPAKSKIIVDEHANLVVGNNSGISNVTIFCKESIVIGNHVLVGGDNYK